MRRELIAMLALTVAACSSSPLPHLRAHDGVQTSPVRWEPWGAEAFARARRQGRLVLVDAGIEGCTACRWQHDITWRDAAIRRRLDTGFVLVSVDADQQPDLGARFEAWGWPALLVFDAEGRRVHAIRGYASPERLAPVLDDLLARSRAGTLSPPAASPAPAPRPIAAESDCTAALSRLDAARDASGWGPFVTSSPVRHALLLAHLFADDPRRGDALRAVTHDEALLDSVWGGVFVGGRSPAIPLPIVPEKRLLHEAAALGDFAAVYRATRDPRWAAAAWEVHRYLDEWMRSPDGLYYSTQQDAPPDSGLTGVAYYALDDAGRRRAGVPRIDRGVYSDQNALLIDAYADLYAATQDPRALNAARVAADVMLATRTRRDGAVAHQGRLPSDARMREARADDRVFLRSQGPWGSALLSMESITGEARYLRAARDVARGTRAALWDEAGGGFFAAEQLPMTTLTTREHPLAENLRMAGFLARLADRTHDDAMRDLAVRALRAVDRDELLGAGPEALALFALADATISYGPVEVTLVGDPSDPGLAALHAAALAVDEPRKLLHYDLPAPAGRYPQRGVAYVCTREVCSSPLRSPSAVVEAMGRFARVHDQVAGCVRP